MKAHIPARAALALVSALLLASCGAEQSAPPAPEPEKVAPPPPPAAPKKVATAEPVLDEAALLKRGKILFLRCRSCHSIKAGEPNKTGPNLHGFLGTAAGTNAAFPYSDALKNSGVTWDAESLSAFIKRPTQAIPGTRMVFAGLARESDRNALIAYLTQETQN